MNSATQQPAEKASPRYVILPDLPLDVYEMPDADTRALIAECPSEVQARLVLTALNQLAAVDALVVLAKRVAGPCLNHGRCDLTATPSTICEPCHARAALTQVENLRKGEA